MCTLRASIPWQLWAEPRMRSGRLPDYTREGWEALELPRSPGMAPPKASPSLPERSPSSSMQSGSCGLSAAAAMARHLVTRTITWPLILSDPLGCRGAPCVRGAYRWSRDQQSGARILTSTWASLPGLSVPPALSVGTVMSCVGSFHHAR
jgi:hypothetical protein